jgi:hypothetical protein
MKVSRELKFTYPLLSDEDKNFNLTAEIYTASKGI